MPPLQKSEEDISGMAMDKEKEEKYHTVLIGGLSSFFVWNYSHISNRQILVECMQSYGGIFVVMAIMWGLIVDKKRPDKFEIIGGIIVLGGASIIFYGPR